MLDNVLSLSSHLVSVDLETTGRDAKKDRIWQIGVVKVMPDGTVTEGSEFVNPGQPIPKELIDKFGISKEKLDKIYSSPPFAHLAGRLHRGLTTAECLVGYNLSFDIRFFVEEFRRCDLAFTPPPIIDGFKIFTHYHPRTLTAAVKEYTGEDLKDAHDGLADARAALRVVVAQLKRHDDLPRDVKELHKRFFETAAPGSVDVAGKIVWKDGHAVLNFGKWSGTRLDSIEPPGVSGRQTLRSYLEWCIRDGDFNPDTKRIMADALAGRFPKPTP